MTEELLALLEEGPSPASQLAAWLEQSVPDVTTALCALAAAGHVHRTEANSWALGLPFRQAQKVAKTVARATDPGAADRHAKILSFIALQPKAAIRIAEMLDVKIEVAIADLQTMQRAGQVKRGGTTTQARWALPTWRKVAEKSHAGVSIGEYKNARKFHRGLDIKVTPEGARAPLRQTPASDTAASWWIGLDRQALSAGAAARQEQMRGSKEAKQVGLRILQ